MIMMRKRGLEVSKKGSFGVDGLDSKKHVKVLIFGCLRTRQKTLTFVSSL